MLKQVLLYVICTYPIYHPTHYPNSISPFRPQHRTQGAASTAVPKPNSIE